MQEFLKFHLPCRCSRKFSCVHKVRSSLKADLANTAISTWHHPVQHSSTPKKNGKPPTGLPSTLISFHRAPDSKRFPVIPIRQGRTLRRIGCCRSRFLCRTWFNPALQAECTHRFGQTRRLLFQGCSCSRGFFHQRGLLLGDVIHLGDGLAAVAGFLSNSLWSRESPHCLYDPARYQSCVKLVTEFGRTDDAHHIMPEIQSTSLFKISTIKKIKPMDIG